MNKLLQAALASAMLVGCGQWACAQSAWLLTQQDSQNYLLSKAVNSGFSSRIDVGVSAIYGDAGANLAVLYYDAKQGSDILSLVDETSGSVVATWPEAGRFAKLNSGPYAGVAVLGKYAYYITYAAPALAASADTIPRNQAGGLWNLQRVSLSDGSQQTYQLPKDTADPIVVGYQGIPLIYSWDGAAVYEFDAATQSVKQLLSSTNITDIEAIEQRAERRGKLHHPGAYADYVALPGFGVYRLSKLGRLYLVLDANLRPVSPARPSVKLGPDAAVIKVFPATLDNAPVVGAIRKLSGTTEVAFINPTSLSVSWQAPLTEGVVPESVAAADNGIIYADQNSGAIAEVSPNGTKTVWKLPTNSYAWFARIVTPVVGQ